MSDKAQYGSTGPANTSNDPAGFLKSLHAIRLQCERVVSAAEKTPPALLHFVYDASAFQKTVAHVVQTIKRDFKNPDSIPPHGRWQHFEVGGVLRVDAMMRLWSPEVDSVERTRRLIDLTTVSVLLDAGAGTRWQYRVDNEAGALKFYSRSEGLAVASLDMFNAGLFSSDSANSWQVDAAGLSALTASAVARGLQASENNPVAGLEGRVELLKGLGRALQANGEYFGRAARPGSMIDYLLRHPTTHNTGTTTIIQVPTLWSVLMQGLGPIWPATRTKLDGQSLGDAWPYAGFRVDPSNRWSNIIPFHKLTQWLCYSIMIPIRRLLNVSLVGEELLTGLPEYRNGGLFVDNEVLKLKAVDVHRGITNFSAMSPEQRAKAPYIVPYFNTDDDVIVEWRALTVGLLDKLYEGVKARLKAEYGKEISLAQMLEAGSWKSGREVAKFVRPQTGEPPIGVFSDGTLF